MKIGIGSVCEIVWTGKRYKHLVGRECSVIDVSALKDRDWLVDVHGELIPSHATNSQLRLKRPPKDAAFDNFLNKLVQPLSPVEMDRLRNEIEAEETV